MGSLGFAIFLSVAIYLDYKCWIRGNDSLFFKDKTQLEKDLRKLQEYELKEKLKKYVEVENDPKPN